MLANCFLNKPNVYSLGLLNLTKKTLYIKLFLMVLTIFIQKYLKKKAKLYKAQIRVKIACLKNAF